MTSVKKCFLKKIFKKMKQRQNKYVQNCNFSTRESDARGMGECKLFCFTQNHSLQWSISWGDDVESLLIKNRNPS